MPLKLASATPVIKTASLGIRPCVAVVVIVTTLEEREAPLGAAIAFTDCRPKSTIESEPAPPGVTTAQFSRGSTATCGFRPVLIETEPITAGGLAVRSSNEPLFEFW